MSGHPLTVTAALRGTLRAHEPMSRHTSWRAGGTARTWYRPADAADLVHFLAALPSEEPLLFVGLGSNLLVRDGGYPGTVVAQSGGAIQALDAHTLWAEAGVPCAKLARAAARAGLVGGEFFAGIPGTVGGALAMNAGAFDGETWRHVVSVDTVDRSGRRRRRSPDDFSVDYRHVQGPEGEWFLGARFRFEPGDPEAGQARIRHLLAQRAQSQPMGAASCGSVFRNPPGDHAARLIEAAGLKGRRRGAAQVSEKHANFILNTGGATAADIEGLIDEVADTVNREHGVALQREVRIVGERA